MSYLDFTLILVYLLFHVPVDSHLRWLESIQRFTALLMGPVGSRRRRFNVQKPGLERGPAAAALQVVRRTCVDHETEA